MRTDEKLEDSVRSHQAWDDAVSRTVALLDVGETVTQSRIDGLKSSFSGHERNHLFISDQAQSFQDLSGVSGLDSDLDGRVFVKWDFNRDGWIDIGVINMNRPRVNLYQNKLAQQAERGHFIAVRFVGGNATPEPSTQYAPRDGYGAKVTVDAGNLKLIREHRCGDGMAAQNSATLLIGIGEHEQADEVRVTWPSGKQQEIQNVGAGQLLTFYENSEDAADQSSGIVTSSYLPEESVQLADSDADDVDLSELLRPIVPKSDNRDGIRIFSSMATWCPSCKEALPQWKYLQAELPNAPIDYFGIPIDAADDAEKLREYIEKYKPAYTILESTPDSARRAFQGLLVKLCRRDVLPSTIITDANFRVLLKTKNVPTLSQVKQALAKVQGASKN